MTWSAERRARQAELVKTWRPWLRSTGPKTSAGKTKSATNAVKHGLRSRQTTAELRQLRQALRRCRDSTDFASLTMASSAGREIRPTRAASGDEKCACSDGAPRSLQGPSVANRDVAATSCGKVEASPETLGNPRGHRADPRRSTQLVSWSPTNSEARADDRRR